jgi:hypothetical protein
MVAEVTRPQPLGTAIWPLKPHAEATPTTANNNNDHIKIQ